MRLFRAGFLLLPVLAGCATATEMRCIEVVPEHSDKLQNAPAIVTAPAGLLNTPAGYVDFWYVTPHYELVLCRYEEARPACADNMNGATFVMEDGGWHYKESYDLVCDTSD